MASPQPARPRRRGRQARARDPRPVCRLSPALHTALPLSLPWSQICPAARPVERDESRSSGRVGWGRRGRALSSRGATVLPRITKCPHLQQQWEPTYRSSGEWGRSPAGQESGTAPLGSLGPPAPSPCGRRLFLWVLPLGEGHAREQRPPRPSFCPTMSRQLSLEATPGLGSLRIPLALRPQSPAPKPTGTSRATSELGSHVVLWVLPWWPPRTGTWPADLKLHLLPQDPRSKEVGKRGSRLGGPSPGV